MLAEGQILDDTYRIVRLIGQGGMGVIYEATHARLAGRYAVKVLPQNLSDDQEALVRFDREARITSSLQHPNIVQVVDFNRAPDGTEYLVMEYLRGHTLGDGLFREGPLPMPVVVGIVEQVAAALAAAHSQGIIHRDLKPDNIFLVPVEGRRFDQVKILDFGISKVREAGALGPVSAVMGTPQYMSPEQCQGLASGIDAATDQFALAVITYEMLTGRLPFSGDSVGEVMSRVVHEAAPPMRLYPELDAVVSRGMAKLPQDRFPSVTDFAEALAAAAGDTTTVTMPTGEAGLQLNGPTEETLRSTSAFTAPIVGLDIDIAEDTVPSFTRRRRRGSVVWAALAAAGAVFFLTGQGTARWWPRSRTVATIPSPGVTKGIDVHPIKSSQHADAPPEGQSDRIRSPRASLSSVGGPSSAVAPPDISSTETMPAAPTHRASVGGVKRRSTPTFPTRPPDFSNRVRDTSPVTGDADATMPLDETAGDRL